ncbi:MAG: SIR2 family NAD-dependent protein deacylase, partial [Gemmatimonadota bacterium]
MRELEATTSAAAIVAEAERVVVLTGAGVSAESGVPTFRGEEGLWRRHRPEELATPGAFARDPRLVWEWYGWRRRKVAACRPNAAHRALAGWALQRAGGAIGAVGTGDGARRADRRTGGSDRTGGVLGNGDDAGDPGGGRAESSVRIVTQNVDALHTVAAREAARAVGLAAQPALPLELHGSLFRVRCTGCGDRAEHREPIDARVASSLPRCERCGELLRPDVVWFGESLDGAVLEAAFRAAAEADACLVVGTSARVHPAASLPLETEAAGGAVVEVNPEPTPLTARAAVSIRAPAGDAVPRILQPAE